VEGLHKGFRSFVAFGRCSGGQYGTGIKQCCGSRAHGLDGSFCVSDFILVAACYSSDIRAVVVYTNLAQMKDSLNGEFQLIVTTNKAHR
jgi:hypothetical protein